MIRTAIAAIIIAGPACAEMGMQCSEYVRHIEMDTPASIMFDIEAMSEFAVTHGVLMGLAIGIEAARPDLEGIDQRTLEFCRSNLNADAFGFMKAEIDR